MFKYKKYLFFFFACFLCRSLPVAAQFYFLEDAHDQIEVKFLKHKIETPSNTTFFNAIKIKNPSSQKLTFQTNFSYPADWSFIGEKQQQLTLGPNDSIIIPFRAAASKDAKGEIGYAIVASLSDLKGNTFKNEYSFVNIPKIQKIKFTPLERAVYIDQTKKTADVKLLLVNNGNTEEVFYIDYLFDNGITTLGAQEGYYREEVAVKPYKDTTVSLQIHLSEKVKDSEKKFHRLGIKAATGDTTIQTSVWARELEKDYYNLIPGSYRMLTLEMIARNLISDADPSLTTCIYGNFLFKKIGGIQYRFQVYDTKFDHDTWKYGRFEFNYKYKGFELGLGDIQAIMAQDMYGRGISLKQDINKFVFKTVATRSVFVDKNFYGLSVLRAFNFGDIEIGGSYVENKEERVNSYGTFISGGIHNDLLGDIHAMFAATNAHWYYSKPKDQLGYGADLRYYKNYNNTHIFGSMRFGQPKYFGLYKGRLEIISQIRQNFSNFDYLTLNYNLTNSKPLFYLHDSILPFSINNYDEIRLVYNTNLTPEIFFSIGPTSESRYGKNFYTYYPGTSLSTRNALLYAALRLRNNETQNTFIISAKGGANFVTHYSNEFDSIALLDSSRLHKSWFSVVLSANYRSRLWGFYLTYYHGPNSLLQQFSWFAMDNYQRTFRLIPYIEFFIYPKYLKYVNRTNFSYDVSTKTTRINLSNDLIAYPGRTWEIALTHTYGRSSNIDKITEEKYTYSSSYFELKLKKDFNINQPRYKYHDLDITFFKDLNGNRVKDQDEPGIKDVLFSITKDEEQQQNEEFKTSGYFMPMELLSDMSGQVTYDNVPSGFYTIEYTPVGAIQGAFTSETDRQNIYIDKDLKLQIPFLENNKIFGKVILNRSKLSNLGFIDIANIKVFAEDSRGKIYSTLTDAGGNFTLYVPTVDKYIVKVNNIYYENFELEQPTYEVQLNGYRQFEVNFIFNEKKRRVNFSTTLEYGLAEADKGIEIVRRTNLSGTVKDASTLQALNATVRVVNQQGEEITSASTNAKTGLYSLSFIAGPDYVLEVNANDYWFYNEKLYAEQVVTFTNLDKNVLLKQITEGSLIPMKTLNFAPGSTEIQAGSFPELERLLKVLKQNPSVKIAVYGHADDIEVRDNPTKDIALERAKIIATYLIANGYNRVKYSGFANTRPIAENETEEGRAQNRRVEIVVTGK
jgi:flagellar motor protein MotB